MEYPFLNIDNQGVAPWQFRFYCLTLVLSYLKKVGKITGTYATNVPDLLETFKIPKPLAKYMEYLGPASRYGAQQTTEFNYSSDLVATSDSVGPEDGLQQLNADGTTTNVSYVGVQKNTILTMSAVGASVPPLATVPSDQPQFTFVLLPTPVVGTPNPNQWSVWMSSAGNMDIVSNCLQRFKIPTVEASWLPGAFGGKRGAAPDSSAYTFYNQSTPLIDSVITDVSVGTCWLNVHDDYDEDISFLFGLSKVVVTTPSVAAKPLTLPIYDYCSRYLSNDLPGAIPWYCQPQYVAIWLANNAERFTRGHWKDLSVKGSRLTSLFPNVRSIGGATFATLAAHCYQQLQVLQNNATKQGTTGVATTGGFLNDNPLLWNWWVLYTSAIQAAQRRFNVQQVVVANCPVFANGAANALMLPQYNWVDSAAMEAKLPPVLSKAIEDLGCCIYRGRLMVPFNGLVNLNLAIPYPVSPAYQYGPITISANGWNTNFAGQYPYENLLTPATYQTTPATALNVQLDNLVLNNGYTSYYLGWNTSLNPPVLFPAFLGGQWIQAYQKLLTAFYMSGNNINTVEKNMEAPVEHCLGSSSALMVENIPNYNAIEQTPIAPNNLIAPGGGATLPLSIIRFPIVGLTDQKMASEDDTLASLANGWVQSENQPVSRSDTSNRLSVLMMTNVANGVALAATATPIPSGIFNVSVKAGNAISGVLAQLCHNTMNPDSQFGKQKELIEKAKNSFGQLIPKNKKEVMEKLSTSRAYRTELAKLVGSAFGSKDRVPQITASSLGHGIGKGMDDEAASTLAVIDSSSQVAAHNATAPQDVENPKHRRMKLDGRRIKKISKALIGTTKKVASGIDDAIKGVSHIADVAGKSVDELGSILV